MAYLASSTTGCRLLTIVSHQSYLAETVQQIHTEQNETLQLTNLITSDPKSNEILVVAVTD